MSVSIDFIEDSAKEAAIDEHLAEIMKKLVILLMECHNQSNRKRIYEAMDILKDVNPEVEL